MKVLHLYRTCYPVTKGGVEQVIRYICKGTQSFGVESRVLALCDESSYVSDVEGTKLILCKKQFEISSNSFSTKLFQEFKKQLKWADIVHFHYPWPTGDLFIYLCKNKPTIVTYHSDIVKQKLLKKLYSPLESKFLNSVNKIIATSVQYTESSDNLKKYKHKTSIIPLAIDPQNYQQIDQKNIRKWSEKTNDKPFFLFIGALRYYKGLQYLLDAANLIQVPVIIAGEGPMHPELESKIINNKLSHVKMVGQISEQDKLSLLSLCKVFIFPSHLRSEAFGVSLIEAQHFKKPIISCDIGTGVNLVNIHNKTGIVVKPANSIELASAMEKLYDNDELCKEMGETGRKRAEELFYMDKMSQQYYQEYKKLLA